MAAKEPTSDHEGSPSTDAVSELPLPSLEESLLSMEKLDRASPELWPEQIPGVSEFAPMQPPSDPPAWKRCLTVDDISYMQKLDALTTSGLIVEVKKLHDLAYKLGTEEAKEMTRGKYLNIFAHRRPR